MGFMEAEWAEPRPSYLPTADEIEHIQRVARTARVSWLESELKELAKDPESTRVVMAPEVFKNIDDSTGDAVQQKALWEKEIKRYKYQYYEEFYRKRHHEMASRFQVKKQKKNFIQKLFGY